MHETGATDRRSLGAIAADFTSLATIVSYALIVPLIDIRTNRSSIDCSFYDAIYCTPTGRALAVVGRDITLPRVCRRSGGRRSCMFAPGSMRLCSSGALGQGRSLCFFAPRRAGCALCVSNTLVMV